MKIRGTLLFLIIVFLLPASLQAQKTTALSFQFKDQTLKSALNKIEKKYNLVFAYDEQLVAQKNITNISAKKLEINLALQKLLSPFNLDFELIGKQYVLLKEQQLVQNKPKEKPPQQIPSICGYIIDGLTNQSLSYANVYLDNANKGVYSDDNGFFKLQGPFSSKDTLIISYVGYQNIKTSLSQLINKPCRKYKLQFEETEVADILVEDRAIALLRASENGTGMRFQPGQMSMLPGWGDNDVLRMAQLLPGIQSSNESASDLHIRGGGADQNLVLWDGIPVYHTGHFFGLFSSFNPYAVDEMNVYRGGFGAKYGGRASGLIDISAKPGRLDSIEAAIGANLISVYAAINIPLIENKSALLLAIRRSFTDIIQSQTYQNLFNQLAGNGKIEDNRRQAEEQNINVLLDPKLYFTDVNAKYVVQPSPKSTASISFYAGSDFLDYQVLFDDLGVFFNSFDKIELSNWGLSAAWDQQWNTQWHSHWNLVLTQFDNKYSFEARRDTTERSPLLFDQVNRLGEVALKFDNDWKFHGPHAIHFGYHFSGLQAEYEFHFAEADSVDFYDIMDTLQGQIHTIYADFDFNIPNRLGIDFGIRINGSDQTDIVFWEPRLSVDWQPFANNFHLKAAVGKYFQFVGQVAEDNDLGLGEEIWIIANSEFGIPILESTQLSGGFWWKKNGWLADVEGYRKRLLNLTTFDLQNSLEVDPEFDIGNADIYGIDVLIKKKLKNYNSWLSYSWGNVQYQFNNLNENRPFPASHDQRHSINWTHLLKLDRWDLSLAWTYGSGRPFTDVEEITSSGDGITDPVTYNLLFEPRNNSRLPDYHRLDFSGHYKFTFMNRVKGKVGLSIFNVYNRVNIRNKEFFILEPTEVGRPPELLQFDREMLGRTPNLFLILEW